MTSYPTPTSFILSLTPDNFLPPYLSSRIFLSPKEIIALTGLPKTTIYDLLTTGRLPAFKVGRHWLVHRNDLYNYLSAAVDESIKL